MSGQDVQMVADRWMLESRQLVNWGSYEGHHEFRPSTDGTLPVTLLAGASESGKSTLVDAQISLLYPTGTPFNKASNSGRSERSDYTYLRGMIGVGAGDDEPIYLRGRDADGGPQAVWGAIVDTYRNATGGETLSCGKFLYLMAGDGRGDVRRQYVAWNRPIDPRLMDEYRAAPFTPGQLKATYPECLTFTSAEAFHTHIWGVMGLSEEACRLLHKIQSADAPSRLDDIFKQGVLGVPEALELARATVEDYDRYAENFHAMEEKTRRMETLRAIRDSYGEYAQALAASRAFAPLDVADGGGAATLRRWAVTRMAGEVLAQLPGDERERLACAQAAAEAGRRSDDLRARIQAVSDQMNGLDGGNLVRLEMELTQRRRELDEVQAARHRIGEAFDTVGERMPDDEAAWDGRRTEAVDFIRTYDRRVEELEGERVMASGEQQAARRELDQLRRDFERQRNQRTRITEDMDADRAQLCRATGLTPADLPYVAELMDVREDEERWRLAMNVVYAPIARTILVDKRHEAGFAAKVSTIDPRSMARRTWRFVDTTRDHDTASPATAHAGAGESWLSATLRYRDGSPFIGWLRAQTTAERYDALCVAAIDDADREHRQVQVDGQVKSGAQGQHGTRHQHQVIGFVNEAYLDELERQVSAAQHRLDEATATLAEVRGRAAALQHGRDLAGQLAYMAWDRVDVHGVRTAIGELETTIASIKNDPKLAELAALKATLDTELDRCEQERLKASQGADHARQAIDEAHDWLRAVAGMQIDEDGHPASRGGEAGAHGPAVVMPSGEAEHADGLGDEATAVLVESYESRMSSLDGAALRAHMIIGAGAASARDAGATFADRLIAGLGADVAKHVVMLGKQADDKRANVETRMAAYLRAYAPDDDSIAASVMDYRYYLDELASLAKLTAVEATGAEYRRCLEQLLMSFLTIKRAIATDADDIHDQLDRINTMLRGQQFGPKHGSLSLHVDVRRPERAFWAALNRVIGTLNDWKSGGADAMRAAGDAAPAGGPSNEDGRGASAAGQRAELRRVFASCAPMVGLLRGELDQVKDMNGVRQYGARDLDPRCRSSFYAIVHHEHDQDERITSTGGRSGGALQELTSFVYGAALIYLLGGGLTSEPSYTTLFLDEALIKADGRYTRRALGVLPRLGFQVIVSAPESKTGEILEVSTKAYVTYKDPDTGHSTLNEASRILSDMPNNERRANPDGQETADAASRRPASAGNAEG